MRLLLFNLATDADDPILGFTSGWIRALAERVETVTVITMRAGRVDLPANVRVHSVGKEKGYGEPRRALEFYRLLWRAVREDRVDACFSHMNQIFSAMAAPVLRPLGIPVVTWYAHPSLPPSVRAAHWVSSRMVSSLPGAYPYRTDKLTVVGQGIDASIFRPASDAEREAAAAEEAHAGPLVLCVGRLSVVKDHPTLLRAVARLRQRRPGPLRVVILGARGRPEDDAYVAGLEALVAELGLGEVVRFAPSVPMEQLQAWYARAAVHVNLTPAGFGDKVAWESMACGCPCVLANTDFAETLGRYAGRLLFRHGDAGDLAHRLERVLAEPPAERARMGAYLREQVIRLHGLPRLADRLVAILEECRPAGRGAGAPERA